MSRLMNRSPFRALEILVATVIVASAAVSPGTAWGGSVPKAVGQLSIPALGGGSGTGIPIFSLSWGLSNDLDPALGGSGGGGSADPAVFETFVVTKVVDSASPHFFAAAASGQMFPLAQIDLFAARGGRSGAGMYVLQGVLVASDHQGNLGGKSDFPIEEVRFRAIRINETVSGSSGTETACWDREQSRACNVSAADQ